MSLSVAAPSLYKQFINNLHSFQQTEGRAHPLNPALSVINLLKSAMSLSIASLMCMCRTSAHTVSASDRTAVLSSYAPTEDWNLYLQCRTLALRQGNEVRNPVHVRVFRPIFDRKKVIRHRLVRELVNKRCDGVNRAVSHDQRRALPRGILFLYSSHARAHVNLHVWVVRESAHVHTHRKVWIRVLVLIQRRLDLKRQDARQHLGLRGLVLARLITARQIRTPAQRILRWASHRAGALVGLKRTKGPVVCGNVISDVRKFI